MYVAHAPFTPSLSLLNLKPQVNLVDGQMFRFDMDDEPGDSARVKLPHKEIIDTLREVRETRRVFD